MQRIEDVIREKLSANLELIENGLVLIDDEYHVKNPNGAGGFIDIFAKDAIGNLVVIELKRSNAAAREAITELSKYAALMRVAKNVKNSELRLIVISTEWHELLVPFSEFYHATDYQLEGYRLYVNSSNDPLKIERVTPLPEIIGRKVSRRHFVRYYKTADDFERARVMVETQAKSLGITDFLIGKFDFHVENLYGATKVLYWAQQLNSKAFYTQLLSQNMDRYEYDQVLDEISEMDDDDTLDVLADNLSNLIDVPCETCEIGYPEKLVQRLNTGAWTLSSFYKYGSFKQNELLSDEMLLLDLKGYTGSSFVYYFGSSKIDNRSKVQEILDRIETCLFHNDVWRQKIKDIINYAKTKENGTITLNVFSKDDLLETLWLSGIDNPLKWIPSFLVVIDPSNGEPAEIFYGNILWSKGTIINIGQVIVDVFDSFEGYLFHKHFGSQRSIDAELMRRLGFEYQVDMVLVSNESEVHKRNITVRGKKIIEGAPFDTLSILEFLRVRQDIIKEVVSLFANSHIGDGIFTI